MKTCTWQDDMLYIYICCTVNNYTVNEHYEIWAAKDAVVTTNVCIHMCARCVKFEVS